MAKPLFGTTLTHYTVLWHLWGGEKLKSWHEHVRRRGMNEVLGNATVKDLVADGVCDWGFTDTDDAFLAQDDGKPVAIWPVEVADGRTICIPNTVAVVQGTTRLKQARQLVDYLLSAEVEVALANSRSRQVPLGPVEDSRLPPEVRRQRAWVARGVPLNNLGPARKACLQWLKSVYVGLDSRETENAP